MADYFSHYFHVCCICSINLIKHFLVLKKIVSITDNKNIWIIKMSKSYLKIDKNEYCPVNNYIIHFFSYQVNFVFF